MCLNVSTTFTSSGSDYVVIVASNDRSTIGNFEDFKSNLYRNRASYAYRHGYNFVWANITQFPVREAQTLHWSKAPVMRAAFDAFPFAKWLWWLDLDSIIMTPSKPLSTFLSPNTLESIMLPPGTRIRGTGGYTDLNISYPTQHINGWDHAQRLDDSKFHLIISQDDYYGLNTGSFFLRPGAWADWLLDIWTDEEYIHKKYGLREQEALLNLMLRHPIIRHGVGMVRQRAINAYPKGKGENLGDDDHQGDNRDKALAGLGQKWQSGDLVAHFAGCGTEGWCNEGWERMWAKREIERHEDVLGAERKRLRGEWGVCSWA
ncbi:hypothetical protein MMC13_007813 [Lambiella insularis]|nr:hypothetical protein [Lambiella insularis]